MVQMKTVKTAVLKRQNALNQLWRKTIQCDSRETCYGGVNTHVDTFKESLLSLGYLLIFSQVLHARVIRT